MTYTFDVVRTHHVSKQKYIEPVTFAYNEIIAYQPHFKGCLVLVKKGICLFEIAVNESYKKLNKDLGTIDRFKKVRLT